MYVPEIGALHTFIAMIFLIVQQEKTFSFGLITKGLFISGMSGQCSLWQICINEYRLKVQVCLSSTRHTAHPPRHLHSSADNLFEIVSTP